MSLLVVGLSHRTAPFSVLERTAIGPDRVAKLLDDVIAIEDVHEAIALATCNRLEIYTDVATFHGPLTNVMDLIALYTGLDRDELTAGIYTYYDSRAVQHLFTVACALDSMVIGEPQILSQLRAALATGHRVAGTGRVLDDLTQTALRVGKRARSVTALDQVGRSLVTAALDLAEDHSGGRLPARACVIGAGSMSALTAATLRRRYPDVRLTLINRTLERAQRLAEKVGGHAEPFDRLRAALAGADLVISCTGATDTLLTARLLALGVPDGSPHEAVPGTTAADLAAPRIVIDLALPRDVAPEVADLPGTTLIDLDRIGDAARSAREAGGREQDRLGDRATADGVGEVRRMISAEVAAYDAARHAASAAPTLVALRKMASRIVEAELERFDGRTAALDPRVRAEVARTVHRIVGKLLHEPTVQVKRFAAQPEGPEYADALRTLFNLAPATTAAIDRIPVSAQEEDWQ